MTDVAELGLKIDTTQAVAAKTALDGLTRAAAPAAASFAAIEKAAASASTAQVGLAAAAAPAAAAVSNLQKGTVAANGALASHATAIKGAATAHGGLSTQAMAASHSIRSMAEGLAMGMPPTQVLTQQLNHLSYAASGPGGLKGAFAEALGALKGFVSPAALVAGGLLAVAAAGYVAYQSVKNDEVALGNLSERVGATVQTLHGLEAAAAFKGINTDDFIKGMEKFGSLTSEAKDHLGSLAALFQANGVHVGDLDDNLLRAADLIKNARTEAEKYRLIQQLGLPATREWVQYLSQGSDAIRSASASAVQFGVDADANLIAKARESQEKWDTFWKNFGDGAKSAVVGSVGYVDQLLARLEKFRQQGGVIGSLLRGMGAYTPQPAPSNYQTDKTPHTLSSVADAVGLNATGTVNPDVEKQAIALEQQRLGALGPLASVTQQVTQRTNELRLARLQNGSQITDADVARILKYTEAQALGTLAIHASADASRIEAGSVGLGVGATAAFRAEQERLADFRLRGISLTDKQAASLHAEATALGEATQAAALRRAQNDADFSTSQLGRTDQEGAVASSLRQLYGDEYESHLNDALAGQLRLNSALADAKQLSTSVFSGMITDLSTAEGRANLLSNALNKMASKLADIAANSLSSALFGKAATSLFGGLLGGGPDLSTAGVGEFGPALGSFVTNHTGYGPGDALVASRVLPVSTFRDAPRFHSGIGPGERAAVIRNDESVLTPGQMKQLSPASATPSVTINQFNTFTNADPGSEARMRAALQQTKDQAVAQAVQAVAKIKADSPGYLRRGN